MQNRKIKTALLISGSGTTAEAIIKAVQSRRLDGIEVVAVIASRPDAGGIKKAQNLGVPVFVSQGNLLSLLNKRNVDLVSLNGWLPHIPKEVIQGYRGRIINQHPGPLDAGRPDFGGKGMYGKRVTCSRIAYAWLTGSGFWTEATTHHVTEIYDNGAVIRVETLPLPSISRPVTARQLRDTPGQLIEATNSVAAALLPLEHKNVIATLAVFARNRRFPCFQRRKRLVSRDQEQMVEQAKALAVALFPNG